VVHRVGIQNRRRGRCRGVDLACLSRRRKRARPGRTPTLGPAGPGSRPPTPAGSEPVSQTSLRTDLAIARQEIRQLRAERDKLRGRLRLQLDAEIEGPEKAELITRISQLEEAARRLAGERDARAAEASHAQHRIGELEDELTAARESLRCVIRDANR